MWTLMQSPVGTLRIVGDDTTITAIDFEPLADPRPDRPLGERADEAPILVEAVRQLTAYFAGTLTQFDLPVAPAGTGYQQRVWEQLSLIAHGQTATYGEIARRLGQTSAASRAVGLANGRNPIPIVIPCHRVVGADGTLTGYAGGLARKQVLLTLESDSSQGALF